MNYISNRQSDINRTNSTMDYICIIQRKISIESWKQVGVGFFLDFQKRFPAQMIKE